MRGPDRPSAPAQSPTYTEAYPMDKKFEPKKGAPRHLSTRIARWWQSVVSSYELEDHHPHLLTTACEFWDRKQEARKIVEKEGILLQDRFGQAREHPAVKIERDSGLMFAKLLRELALDVDAPGDVARPPAITGHAHRRARCEGAPAEGGQGTARRCSACGVGTTAGRAVPRKRRTRGVDGVGSRCGCDVLR